MSRQKPENASATWSDVATAVLSWEAHYGVRICAHIEWRHNLSAGACVEVVITDGLAVGKGPELVRLREAFPTRKASGQAGAVLWAISCAIRALELEPWQWSAKMRREAARGV